MTWVCQNVRGDPRGTPTKLYGHISKTGDFAPKSLYYAKVKEALSRFALNIIKFTLQVPRICNCVPIRNRVGRAYNKKDKVETMTQFNTSIAVAD